LKRIVETFIPIGLPNNANRLRNRYFDLLRTCVSPLIAELYQHHYIGWFSFLVHDRKTGRIPIPEGDGRLFIHLRLERSPRVSVARIREALPEICEHTRPMRANVDRSLGIKSSALTAPEIATGWRLFGLSSDWTLHFVTAHRNDEPIPEENVCQFFHYIENQLQMWTLGCQVTCPTRSNQSLELTADRLENYKGESRKALRKLAPASGG